MSDTQNSQYWTEEALKPHKSWEKIRNLARQALCRLNWSEEMPPKDPKDQGNFFIRSKSKKKTS
ncbi:MAG: hypothetical protein ACFFBD_04000 [Candidatus Hodarchaeota archaeon]